jgi:XTP/dITP diphosphohydrolase
VFADGAATTPDEVNAQWETIKADEKRRAHPLDDLPASLPALARAQKVVSRLRKAGTPSSAPSQDSADGGARLGAALLALVIEADAQGVDAEAALRAATRDLERSSRA